MYSLLFNYILSGKDAYGCLAPTVNYFATYKTSDRLLSVIDVEFGPNLTKRKKNIIQLRNGRCHFYMAILIGEASLNSELLKSKE